MIASLLPGEGDPYTRSINSAPAPPKDPYLRSQIEKPPPPVQLDMFDQPDTPFPGYVILRDDQGMSVMPATEEAKKFLTLHYRTMEKVGRRTDYVQHAEPLYRVMERDGKEFLHTYQGLWRSLKEHLEKKGRKVQLVNLTIPFMAPNLARACHGLTDPQQPMIISALLQDCSGLIGAPTRYGKCLDPDTPVMMADGAVRPAKTIRDGDLVMGQDGSPRRVVGCISGRDIMYKITPNKGEAFTCTQDHKLLLKRTPQGGKKSPNKDGQEILTTPADIAKASKTWLHLHKLVKRAVTFEATPVEVDPYCYGLWLGDGNTERPTLTSADPVCVRAWLREGRRLGLRRGNTLRSDGNKSRGYPLLGKFASERKGTSKFQPDNHLLRLVKESSKDGSKRVAQNYKANSREVQLQVLAGYLDADGGVNNGKTYSVTSKYETLVQDVQFIARSLGFRATIKPKERSAHAEHRETYYELHISGAVDEIPVRLTHKKITGLDGRVDPLVTGFKCECVGEGEYYGFELEGPDRLFLLGDFTVTHNTYMMAAICRAYNGLKIVVTAPGVDLCRQLEKELKEIMPDRDVRGIYTGSKHRMQGPDITVCSVDSLDKCDAGGTELLLIDEPHAMVADGRLPKINRFFRARKFGFGATLEGRFDKKDRLIEALIGPVLVTKSYLEAVAEGSISPLTVVFVTIPFSKDSVPGRIDRDKTWERLLTKSSKLARVVRSICDEKVPRSWQTMLFIKDEKQADYLLAEAMDPTCSVAMAKKLKTGPRKTLTERIARNEISRILASKIYIQGVTFPDLRLVVNCMSGGATTAAIQMPGRLLQKRPGKRYGVMVDFIFECVDADQEERKNPAYNALIGEGWSRHKLYKKVGYDIVFAKESGTLEDVINNSYETAYH